ncbi:glycosyltransferase family 4 protein [Gloeocapsopsis dulcis]|uniref:Glycosyl transferase family 1 n=1 Tax=Gloeocapsopsis dulcis AAB1 = 1H9 TaxID=1433147 RepID=A0A6N8FPN1_9CHRO|nr:glycosyltransferase family 4 protein [Gloeocapsopsis dulcis]MUL34989.1 glycosyl transferase family 1 [Gloeocapsopsis dulcis AAB1 = 1H9]WNN89936.1 glycosyltransferase family 4 protein [Gloeocapsopsis dulcis]
MRIAYICADPGVPVFGCKGCSIHVQEVIRALLKQGHQVELFTTRLGGEPPVDLATISVHQLPQIPKGDRAQRETAALSINLDLRLALENSGDFDLVYERYSLWSFTAMEYARAANIPGILEVNAPLIEEHAQHRGLVNHEAAYEVAQRVFGAATALVAVSQGVADYLASYPVARRIHVIPNGVNPDRFAINLNPSLPAPAEVFTVGFVGTMKPWHGLDTLIAAFEILHCADTTTRLLIVGDGPTKDEVLENLGTRHLTQAVHLTGAVTAEAIPGLLASMDVAVAPYAQQPHFYFSPLKVYEYMAAGLPIVGSNIGQISRLIQNQKNGLLCSPGDGVQLATLLDQLRMQPELRLRLGQAARKTVLENHTWDVVVQQILSLVSSSVVEVSY